MPFDVRCPDCKAKLRLDDKPAKGVPIECPKCGSTFAPEAVPAGGPAAEGKAKGKKGKGKDKDKPKDGAAPPGAVDKEAQERTFMNPFLLLGIIGGVLVSYLIMCSIVLYLLGRSGRIEDMVGFLPKDSNLVRGINLDLMAKYPGYKGETDRYAPPPIRAALEALETASGAEEPGAFDDYMVHGRFRAVGGATSNVVYAVRSKEDIVPATLKAGLGATDAGAGQPGVAPDTLLRAPDRAPGILARAYLYLPTKRHVVIVPAEAGGQSSTAQTAALASALAAAKDPSAQSFTAELGDTGRVAMRGHGWTVAKVTGAHEKTITDMVTLMKQAEASPKADLTSLSERLAATKTVAVWNSFGGKVRFGAGLECGSSSEASGLSKTLKQGVLGQGDEVDPPKWLKAIYPTANAKEFRQIQAKMDLRASGRCAYIISSMGGDKNAQLILQLTGMPEMFDGGPTARAAPGGGGMMPGMP